MIPITLTKDEARLCREAAKLARSEDVDVPLLDHGEQRLSREEWFEVQQWLTFAALDWESRMTLETRWRLEKLSARIMDVIERYDETMGPVVVAAVVPEKVERQGALF